MSSVKIRIERLEKSRSPIRAATALVLMTEGGALTPMQERDLAIARSTGRPVLRIAVCGQN